MQRLVVIGTSGSGKSTFARQLASRLQCQSIELDGLHWDANWTPVPADILRARVQDAVSSPCWVVDGNYGRVRDLIWAQADTIVWLDYPLWLVLWRVIKRTFWRSVSRQVLWNGNREPLYRAFTRDSIILWAITTYQRHRNDYAAALTNPDYAHLRFVRLTSPGMAQTWLANVTIVS